MKTALFLIVPHLSHYYPTFGLARLMRQQGYRIVYGVTHEFYDVVNQEGFDVNIIQFSEEYAIKKLKIFIGLFLKTCFDTTYTKKRYRDFLRNMLIIENLVDRLQPDIVILEDTLTHYYPIIAKRSKVVQLSTKLSSHKCCGIPPLSSFWLPRGRVMDEFITNLLWLRIILNRRAVKLIEKIVFNGKDDDLFQKRYEQRIGFFWNGELEKNMSFYVGLKNIASVVMAPLEIEFPWRKLITNEYYLTLPSTRNEYKMLSPAYEQFMLENNIRERYRSNLLIYVSLGTLSFGDYEKARKFLINAIKAINAINGVTAVIATGGIDIDGIISSKNIHYLPALPQLDLLQYCDLMITHGGLGTIKECLERGVPMLVYPLNILSDQPGNSARIVVNGWGLRGRITDPPNSIKQNIMKILDNQKYRSNCQQISNLIACRIRNPVQLEWV